MEIECKTAAARRTQQLKCRRATMQKRMIPNRVLAKGMEETETAGERM